MSDADQVRACPDGYPTCRMAEAGAGWCRGQCQAIDTASEFWRARCEARTVMRWTKEDRQGFYGLVLQRRGAEAMNKLIDDVRVQWREEQERVGIALQEARAAIGTEEG